MAVEGNEGRSLSAEENGGRKAQKDAQRNQRKQV